MREYSWMRIIDNDYDEHEDKDNDNDQFPSFEKVQSIDQ